MKVCYSALSTGGHCNTGANSSMQPHWSRQSVLNRFIYNILFTLIFPLIIVRLLWRSIKAPAYARRWAERFGLPRLSAQQRRQKGRWLWIHAVSVGESIAAAPLVRKLRLEHPDLAIVISTMTPTGSARVLDMFGDEVCHVYAPYDHPCTVLNFLRRLQPQLLVIMETELWPNIVHYTKRSGARVIVANARLSEKSARAYEKFPRLIRPMLDGLDCIAAQAESDAQRFIRLGADPAKVPVTGSIKFEIDLPAALAQQRQALRAQIQGERPILIAASTRDGEEEKVLEAYKLCREKIPALLLILVPRHPERFRSVEKLCQAQGLRVVKRSDACPVAVLDNVFLGDSMGEMLSYFGVSDVAFVGGSLVDTGCHNVLEPAALGLPVLVGPSQFNFQTICRQLEEAGALHTVSDARALAKIILTLFAHAQQRQAMGAAGVRFISENKGALERTYQIVMANLNFREPSSS